jgi:hypothetical protein
MSKVFAELSTVSLNALDDGFFASFGKSFKMCCSQGLKVNKRTFFLFLAYLFFIQESQNCIFRPRRFWIKTQLCGFT